MSLRLVVGSANPNIRMSFSMLAKATPGVECVGTAQDAKELMTVAEQTIPHIIYLEEDLLAQTGRDLRLANPRVKLILLHTAFEERDMTEIHAAGAVGYICQDSSSDDIRRAVEAAAFGNTYRNGQGTHIASPHPAVYFQLTANELQILGALPLDDLAKTAQHLGLSPLAAEMYLSSAIAKLGVGSAEEAQDMAIRHGILGT